MDYSSQVIVTGLSNEQKMFKESLMQEANAYMTKVAKRFPVGQEDRLEVHIKTHTATAGKQHRYEVKAKITLGGEMYNATNDHGEHNKKSWELNLAFTDALDELFKQIDRIVKKPAAQARRNFDLKNQPEEE